MYDGQRQSPGYSRDRSQRASTSSPLSSQDYRTSTMHDNGQMRHFENAQKYSTNATPSPQARYASHHAYTSSPSPLARRSESRQSNHSQASTLSSFSRSNDRHPASESLHSVSSEDPYASHSRATTPKPRDFQDTGDSSFTSSEDEDEQSTTPRSEMKRWTPSNVGARGNARYSSEPPPEMAAMTPIRQSTYRTGRREMPQTAGYDVESGEKVESWRGAGETLELGSSGRRRSALPAEFTNHVVGPGTGRRPVSSLTSIPCRPALRHLILLCLAIANLPWLTRRGSRLAVGPTCMQNDIGLPQHSRILLSGGRKVSTCTA